MLWRRRERGVRRVQRRDRLVRRRRPGHERRRTRPQVGRRPPASGRKTRVRAGAPGWGRTPPVAGPPRAPAALCAATPAACRIDHRIGSVVCRAYPPVSWPFAQARTRPAQPGRVLSREPLPGRASGPAMTRPAVAALLRGLFAGHPAVAESPRGGRRPVPSLQVRRLRPPSLSTRRSRRPGRVRAAGDEAVAVPGVRPPAAKITFTGRDRTAPVSEDGHLQARRSPCGCGPELGTGGALGAGGFSSGPQPWHRLRGDESRW